ncbi:MAG TPA: alpha/beta fold hydrolase [Limnochordia bacterium]|nr:alpha/beta fold hydrolase [Limnochordia bacterium]
MRYPVSFYNQGQKLIGVVHRPAGGEGERYPAVVLCHGFTGQKVEPHRIFVKMAEALADRGYLALRFDFRGSGDSEGDFHKVNFEDEVSDAVKAVDYLVAAEPVDPERIGVLGLSMGGAVAACLSGRDPRIKATVLWAAVSDFQVLGAPERWKDAPWMPEHEAWDVGGLLVGRRFFEGMERTVPWQEIKKAKGPVLVLHGDGDTVVPIDHAHRYQQALGDAGIPHRLVVLEGADHTFNRYAWEQQVIQESAAWFVEHL